MGLYLETITPPGDTCLPPSDSRCPAAFVAGCFGIELGFSWG